MSAAQSRKRPTGQYLELSDRSNNNSPISPIRSERSSSPQPQIFEPAPDPALVATTQAPSIHEVPVTSVAVQHQHPLPWNVLLEYFVHLLPICITISILALTFKAVYWIDLGKPHINSVLNSLQFAAKFHELTITASITSLVLHRLRFELIEMDGLPLGLVTTGYRLSELTFFISLEFWAGILVRVRRGSRRWRPQIWLPLSILLPVAIFLTSTVGPSSAIVMIPQLSWWNLKDPFDESTLTTYVHLKNDNDTTWPTNIDATFLPEDCESSLTQQCPWAGLTTIEKWVSDFQNNNIRSNFTIPNDGQVERYLTAAESYDSKNKSVPIPGHTASSTVHVRAARDLGAFWEYIVGKRNVFSRLQKTLRPMIIPSSTTGMEKPLVQIQCHNYTDNSDASTISFHHEYMKTSPVDRFGTGNWTIPYFDISATKNHLPNFRWVDMRNYPGKPTLGAIFVTWSLNDDKTTPLNVITCTIDASWAPVKIWLDPQVDNTVLQDSTDPIKFFDEQSSIDDLKSITIDMDWAEALNFMQSKTRSSKLPPGPTGNYSAIERLISGFGYPDASGDWLLSSIGDPRWCCSTALGLYLSDALARTQSDLQSALYRKVASDATLTRVSVLSNFLGPTKSNLGYDNTSISWEDFVDQQGNWTENTYEVKTYGYGWGTIDIPSILAIIVLFCHTVLAVVHLVSFSFSAWRCRNWDSMGEMLALALKSKAVEKLNESSARVEFDTWKTNTRITKTGMSGPEFEMSVE